MIFPFIDLGLLLVKNPGPSALPQMKQRLASAIHYCMLFQMSINYVVLRGFVGPDKEVEITRLEDKDGDPKILL